MGFMDKAKKLAEQAQQKLDETQKNFNQSNSPAAPAEGGVKYDEHGRPVQEAPPAGATAPPAAEPTAPAAEPTAPAPGEAPASESPAESPAADSAPAPPPSDGANTAPDPFKPIQ
jgi:hypothetical protein